MFAHIIHQRNRNICSAGAAGGAIHKPGKTTIAGLTHQRLSLLTIFSLSIFGYFTRFVNCQGMPGRGNLCPVVRRRGDLVVRVVLIK
jgi:hypothetical protein